MSDEHARIITHSIGEGRPAGTLRLRRPAARPRPPARTGPVVRIDDATPAIVFLATDPEGTITVADGRALERLDRDHGQLVGRSILEIDGNLRGVREHARRALAGESFETREELGGLTFECAWRALPGGATVGIAVDSTEARRSEQRLAHLGLHDPLTGLPNRSTLAEHLERELARTRRDGDGVIALYIDLDHFKRVNDSLGHAAGDEVLVQVAELIRSTTRGGELVARLGSDEFVHLCPVLGSGIAETARATAAKLLAQLERPLTVRGVEFQLGASIGIAIAPGDGHVAEELLKHAHAAMYHAKGAGRNTYAFYGDDDDECHRRLTLTARLRRAVSEDELVLHFQPLFDLAGGTLDAVEALVRWDDPSAGLVPPAAFIRHAEESALISRIGAWVVDAVCRQAADWRALGLEPLISFNAAPRELRDVGYVDRFVAALARHDLSPSQFMIEVTESAMGDSGGARPTLEELHRLGVILAIDDFGTHHSSLARLRDVPARVLKIDRSFLRDVPGDLEAAAIVEGIATLGAGLGMHVVAEGIETAAQLEFAERAGCGHGQGYHLSWPLPASELTPRLAASGRPATVAFSRLREPAPERRRRHDGA